MLVFLAATEIRYHTAPDPHDPVLMAYASGPQKPYYEDPSEEDPDYAENAAYLRRTAEEAASEGAGLIAYAEEAFIVTGEEKERLLKEAGAIAAENDLYMLICLDYEDDDGYLENAAIFIDSEGHQISEYDIYKVLTPMWTIFVAIVLADLIRIVITQIRARKARRNSAAVSE